MVLLSCQAVQLANLVNSADSVGRITRYLPIWSYLEQQTTLNSIRGLYRNHSGDTEAIMQKLSLAIAVTSLLMAAGCAQQRTTMQQEGAEHIVVSKDPAPAGAELLQTITAVDGSGCRGFGHVGVRPLVEIDLRNQAFALGGDYVQIVEARKPGSDAAGPCLSNGYQLQGQVYRVPGTRNLAQRLAQEGPPVFASQGTQYEEPGFQPRAVKPREMRSQDDRERMLPGEENWPHRNAARYVSVYSEEGQRIVRGLDGRMTREAVRVIPADQAPKRVELPASAVRRVESAPSAGSAPAAAVSSPAVAAPVAPRMLEPVVSTPKVAVEAPAVVAPAPVVPEKPVVAAPAVVARPAVTAPAPVVAAPAPVVRPVVLPPAPRAVTSIEPPSMSSGSPIGMPRPDVDAARMPLPQLAADDLPPAGVRQVTLSPASKPASHVSAGTLPREERDRMLEELARDNSLSYDEYQRRYREIMAQ